MNCVVGFCRNSSNVKTQRYKQAKAKRGSVQIYATARQPVKRPYTRNGLDASSSRRSEEAYEKYVTERQRRNAKYINRYSTVPVPSLVSTSDNLTDTILETPFSCMVTPKRVSAWFMVGFLWVITINCVSFEKRFK